MSGVTGAGSRLPQQPERTTVANTAASVASTVAAAVLLPVAVVGAAAEIATKSVLNLTSSPKSDKPANVVSFVDNTEKSFVKAASAGVSVVKGAADNIGDAAKIAEKAIEHVAHNILNFLRGNPESK